MSLYCADLVKHNDNDRYLCALLAPINARPRLMALYAFNLEIAAIAERVSEPGLGLVRLQWWRDTIGKIYQGEHMDHPVAQALAETIRNCDLHQGHFQALLDAREFDMNEDAPTDMKALEDYAQGSSSTLIALALEILGVKDDTAAKAGRLVGVAWALAGLLRAIPFHARMRRLYLPQDMCRNWGMVTEALFAARPCSAFTRVTAEIATLARARLEEARSLRRQVPKQARAALLLGTLAEGYLNRLQAYGFDPFQAVARKRSMGMLTALGFNAFRGRY